MKNSLWRLGFGSGEDEKGFLEFSILSLVALAFVLSAMLGGWMRSHYRFVQAHVEEVKKEYELEGVLWEAVTFLEERGPGFNGGSFTSSFVPSYTVTVAGDRIMVKKGDVSFIEAQFLWRGGVIELVRVENPFVRTYAR